MTRSGPCAAPVTRWVDLTGVDAGTSDILHLAEPLIGVADVGHAGTGLFLAGLGNRLANLARCETQGTLLDAVAHARPDYVILGGAVDDSDLAALRGAMHTATLGVVLLGPQEAAPDPVPQIEIEVFDPAEGPDAFTLRLRALMRRCRPVALTSRCRAGGLMLDEAAMTLNAAGETASLSLEDFRLLGPLFDVPGRVWPREDLLRLAYGSQTRNGLRTIDVKLNRTRRRLRAALALDPIRSVRGEGYTLAAD